MRILFLLLSGSTKWLQTPWDESPIILTCHSLVSVKLRNPTDLATCEHSCERSHTSHTESLYQITFFSFEKETGQHERLSNLRERNNGKIAGKEGRNQRYASYLSILLRSSGVIIHPLVYSTQHTFIERNKLFIILYPFSLPKRVFFDKNFYFLLGNNIIHIPPA